MSAPAGRPAVVMDGQARFPEGRMNPGFYRGRFGPVRSSARLFARWPWGASLGGALRTRQIPEFSDGETSYSFEMSSFG